MSTLNVKGKLSGPSSQINNLEYQAFGIYFIPSSGPKILHNLKRYYTRNKELIFKATLYG